MELFGIELFDSGLTTSLGKLAITLGQRHQGGNNGQRMDVLLHFGCCFSSACCLVGGRGESLAGRVIGGDLSFTNPSVHDTRAAELESGAIITLDYVHAPRRCRRTPTPSS